MKATIAKQMFKSLREDDKLNLIEKLMPNSGAYRQLENKHDWTDKQWIMLACEFLKQDNWAKGIQVDRISVHDKCHVVNGVSELGNAYEGIGFYSDNELLFIEDLEFIGHENREIIVEKLTIEESKINKGCLMLIATDISGQKYVVGGNPHFPHFLDKYESCFEMKL